VIPKSKGGFRSVVKITSRSEGLHHDSGKYDSIGAKFAKHSGTSEK
jgi:hypothetical protein